MSRARMAGGLVAALSLIPAAATAQTDGRFSTDVSVTAGYSNNPFTSPGSNTDSAVIGVTVAPRYQLLRENSALTLSGVANFQQYLRRYSRNESYAAALDYQLRPSERVTAHARVDLSSAVLGAFNNYLPFVGSGVPAGTGGGPAFEGAGGAGGTGSGIVPGVTPVVDPAANTFPALTDIGLFGLRNRRNTGRVSGDFSVGMSVRDTLTVSAYAEATRYNNLRNVADFEAYSTSLGYSRLVSDRFSVGVRASASLFDYQSGTGDSRIFPIAVTASGRLNELWSVNGSLGATIIDGNALGSTRSTSVSGDLNLCRRGPLSSMCAQLARQALPTGLVGTQYVTSVGLNWRKQLDERSNASLGANYSRVGGNSTRLIGGLPGGTRPLQTEYVQAVLGYDRQLGQRLRFVASASYRQLLNGNAGRPNDFGGLLGLSYRLGDPR